ncbi:MAG: zf-TFIIB domain-containing protein [Pyrinomonadaceae bacterium]
MRCPVCNKSSFVEKELEPNLNADVCSICNGVWVTKKRYEEWLATLDAILPRTLSEETSVKIPEFELARLCPTCRRVLIKYEVGNNIPFKIDRCSSCGGVWLEANEWDILKSRNLHDELDKIFTDKWQEEVRRENVRNTLKQIY